MQVHVGLHVVVDRTELIALVGSHIDSPKSRSREAATQRHLAEVGEFGGSARYARHATAVVKVGHAELVDPHLSTFVQAVVRRVGRGAARVANTHHHRADPPEVGRTHHTVYPVAIYPLVGHCGSNVGIGAHGGIAFKLERRPDCELDVDIVGRGPYHIFCSARPRRYGEGHFVFVVVLAVVVSEAHKKTQVPVVQTIGIVTCFCVHKHFHALVHAHIDAGVLEDGASVSVAEPAGAQAQRLLVLLQD